MIQQRKSFVPVALFAGLAGISAIATGWFSIETYLLAKKKQPITFYVRNVASWHPWLTGLASAAASAAVTAGLVHFVADEEHNP